MQRYNILFSIFLSTIFFLSACGSRDEIGFKDSRTEYMAEYKKVLSKQGIPFYMSPDGHIMYPSEHAENVEKIKKEVSNYMSSEVGTKYDNELSTNYLRKVLKDRSIPFRIETKNGEDWTFWRPESDSQRKEIETKVINYYFDKQQEEMRKE
jgi:hypothetical protein